jgi:O-Antigen ligase
MRAGILHASRLVLLGGVTALAFFAGGYFNAPRAWAGLAVWALVVTAVLLDRRPLRSLGAWLAIGGLFLFGAFTLLSMLWAPIVGSAYAAGQIVFLYLGALLAAALLLRDPAVQRVVEPALAAGTLIVIGYGISERLLPGLLHFARSASAQGRLEQPLTYWNAMGELAALGFVLSTRLAGDSERPRGLRAAAAAACAPLGLGLYLSFSRGALFACVAGLVALIVLAPRRSQLEGVVIAALAGGLAAAAAAPFAGVTSLAGSLATRERQGAIMLALLVVIAGLAAGAGWWRAHRAPDTSLRLPRHSGWIALGVICAGLALAIVVGSKEAAGHPLSGGVSRLGTLQSNRYDYWRVGFRAFAAEPIHGVGAGGWSVWWLRYRTINDFAQDAHSLPVQTLAELGLVGIALLLTFFLGVGLAARDAYRLAPSLAAGPIAGFVTYTAHAPLDWDWQMPAVTLVAIVLAGALLAQAQPATSSAAMARRRRLSLNRSNGRSTM